MKKVTILALILILLASSLPTTAIASEAVIGTVGCLVFLDELEWEETGRGPITSALGVSTYYPEKNAVALTCRGIVPQGAILPTEPLIITTDNFPRLYFYRAYDAVRWTVTWYEIPGEPESLADFYKLGIFPDGTWVLQVRAHPVIWDGQW